LTSADVSGLISFSLFGDARIYLDGALPNLLLSRTIYPSWRCRFYVSQEIPASLTLELEAAGAEVIPMQRRDQWDGLFWRFLAVEDPGAEYVIVRDVDARLSRREGAAVDEWIASGRPFHIMRDHPLHNAAILGGMWGCRRGVLPDIRRMIGEWQQFDRKGGDQGFLAIAVYPRIKTDALVHSDLLAFEGETVAPFPTPRERREWVGATVVGSNAASLPPALWPAFDSPRLIVEPWTPIHTLFWRLRSRVPRPLRPAFDPAYQAGSALRNKAGWFKSWPPAARAHPQ
jgi:hypothetical protein